MIFFSACSSKQSSVEKEEVSKVIPITMANLRGHKSLYDQGWFVVSSSKKSLDFAKEMSITSSGAAIKRIQLSLQDHTKVYQKEVKEDLRQSLKSGKKVYQAGSKQTQKIFEATNELAKAQWAYGTEGFSNAWNGFIKGNISLASRTAEDREALMNIPGDYFNNLKEDFSNIYEIAASINGDFGKNISSIWSEALTDSKDAFMQEYEKSGESENSFTALFNIFSGYIKSAYYGLIKPVTQTTTYTAYTGVKNSAKLVFLPIAATASWVGRRVQSIGLTLYYSTSIGIKVISPSVEAGFLSALSILSLGTTPITYVTGATLGSINQVSTVVAAPTVTAVQAASSVGLDTTKLVTFVSYDAIKGSTKVIFNQAASGVVLGYNALTALPTHLFLGLGDAAFFLAWDGPKLVVALAKGTVKGNSIKELPVGTVVDIQKLQEEKDIVIEKIPVDQELIQMIFEKLPADMKVES